MGYKFAFVQFLLCTLLIAGVFWQSRVPTTDNDPPGTSAAFEISSSRTVALNPPSLETLRWTTARPLFTDTRRPHKPEPKEEQIAAAETPEKVPTLGPFVLSAIVIVDEHRAVLLTNPENGRLTRVIEGDDVAGWSLEAIKSDSVVLTNAGRRQEIKLRQFGARQLSSKQQQKQRKKRRKAVNTAEQHSQTTNSSQSDDEYCGLSRC